jgi:hypothetical protein
MGGKQKGFLAGTAARLFKKNEKKKNKRMQGALQTHCDARTMQCMTRNSSRWGQTFWQHVLEPIFRGLHVLAWPYMGHMVVVKASRVLQLITAALPATASIRRPGVGSETFFQWAGSQ